MQIDFHHAVTYVAARAAGFEHDRAEVVAHGAQYVDDATTAGLILFDNDAMYTRIRSAHRLIDLENLDNRSNLQVWLPFHFLPGNDGLPAGEDPQGTFIQKIICRPNSHVAREMVERCILEQDRPCGLHRLAVTMHVFADTWAHQGFAGVLNQVNEVHDTEDLGGSEALDAGPKGLVGRLLEHVLPQFIHAIPEIGHAQARVLPDLPFLRWTYRNGRNEVVTRDNTALFVEAADEMCKAMQRYLRQDPRASVPGLDDEARERIRVRLAGIKNVDADERHALWLRALAADEFKFGPVELGYDKDRWKREALAERVRVEQAVAGEMGADCGILDAGEAVVDGVGVFRYRPEFLSSNWKLFHDAVQLHRLTVLHEILPRYGICSG